MADDETKRNLLGEMGHRVDDTLKTFQPPPKIIKSNRKVFIIGYITGGITVGIMMFFVLRIWELFV